MEPHTQHQDDLRLYLLGLLPPERQTPLEERLFTDAGFYEELLITEDELVDEYLAGGLTAGERGLLEARLAEVPERGRQLRFAGALRRYVAAREEAPVGAGIEAPAGARVEPSGEAGGVEPSVGEGVESSGAGAPAVGEARAGVRPEPGADFLGWLRLRRPVFAVAAALLLITAVAWVVVRSVRPREPRAVFAAQLTPGGVTRAGGDVQQLVVPAGAGALRLELRLAARDHQTYRAALLDAEGATLHTADRLAPQVSADGAPFVVFTVPAHDAPPGDYQLRLTGLNASAPPEPVATYRFRITRP